MKALLISGFSALVFAQVADAQVFLRSLNFNGSGCTRFDSRGQLYDVDRDGLPEQFQILYSNYIAEQGPGLVPSAGRKNCNITVQMNIPQGHQFSITKVRFLGYAELPAGVRGRQRTTYEFPFYSNSATFDTVLVGPFSDNYDRTDTLGVSSWVWSPCGLNAPFNIRSEARLEGSNWPSAFIGVDQTDGQVKQIYQFSWRRCR